MEIPHAARTVSRRRHRRGARLASRGGVPALSPQRPQARPLLDLRRPRRRPRPLAVRPPFRVRQAGRLDGCRNGRAWRPARPYPLPHQCADAARRARRGAGVPRLAGCAGDGVGRALRCDRGGAAPVAALPRGRRQPCRALPARAGSVALPLRSAALPSRASLSRRLDRAPVPGAGRRRHRRRRPDLRRAAHLARPAPARQGGRLRPAQGARPHSRPRRALRRALRRCSARRRRGHRDGLIARDCRAGDPRRGGAVGRQPRRVRSAARHSPPRHRPRQ